MERICRIGSVVWAIIFSVLLSVLAAGFDETYSMAGFGEKMFKHILAFVLGFVPASMFVLGPFVAPKVARTANRWTRIAWATFLAFWAFVPPAAVCLELFFRDKLSEAEPLIVNHWTWIISGFLVAVPVLNFLGFLVIIKGFGDCFGRTTIEST